MALDARYSVLAGHLEAGLDQRICFLLEHLGFRLWHPALRRDAPGGGRAVLAGLRDFREHLGGVLTITLLADVGVGVDVNRMDEDLILAAIDWLGDREST